MSNTDGGFGFSGWNIAESDSYDESVIQCGGHKAVDGAIAWVDFFLNRNPLAFSPIRRGSPVRILKTKLRIKGTTVYPAYRLLFTLDEATKTVTKLHVAASEPEDMAFGDPWDADETPF